MCESFPHLLNWIGHVFLAAMRTVMSTVRSRIYLPTLSRSSLWKAPFQRSAILSWTQLRCTFQVKHFFNHFNLQYYTTFFIKKKQYVSFFLFDCSLAEGNPDVHFSLGCVEWTGHASLGAALFGLPWVLHLCKVSPSVITNHMCHSLFVSGYSFLGFYVSKLQISDWAIWNLTYLLLHKR